MKRQLAALDLFTIALEMQELQGCFVDKIYQLTKDDFLIKLRNPATKKKEQLYIRNGDFLCLTDRKFSTPLSPSNFCMVLRKYLVNARITSIKQQQFDRIINIQFSKNQTYTLVIELFSTGNIILINGDNQIILPLIHQEWAHRRIRPREKYTSPPFQRNPFHISKDEFINLLTESKSDLVRTLALSLNLSGAYAEEVCARAGIKKDSLPMDLMESDLTALYDVTSSLLERIKSARIKPVCVIKQGEIYTVLPFEFQSYTNIMYQPVEHMVRGLEGCITATVFKTQGSQTQIQLEKLNRQLTQQQQAIQEFEEKIIEHQTHAELLYFHFQLIDQQIKEIQSLLNEKDKTHLMNFLNENSLIDSFDLAQKTIQVKLLDSKGANRTITVNIKKSIAENAKIAYEESKKFKDKLDGVKKAILQTNKRINTLQEKLRNEEAQLQQKETKSQRMLWFEKYRWFISSNGNLVIGGKDAKTNDQIVKKHLESTDRYVHADIHGAPSCIIKNKTHDGKPIEITQESISEACEFASSYSKAWKQFTESQAYWVLPEQVSKTPQSGEFVPKGAFIIRGRRNYCKCKLEIGIGLLQIDGGEKIIGGPTQAIEKWCKQYVTLRPDGTNKKILTKKLSKLFNISIDEVNKVLPPGDSAIVSIHGFTQLIP